VRRYLPLCQGTKYFLEVLSPLFYVEEREFWSRDHTSLKRG
jgi:hypothetical protein